MSKSDAGKRGQERYRKSFPSEEDYRKEQTRRGARGQQVLKDTYWLFPHGQRGWMLINKLTGLVKRIWGD